MQTAGSFLVALMDRPLPDYSNDQLVFLMLAIFRELSHRVGVTVSPVDMVFEILDQPEAWAHNSSRLQMQRTLHPHFVIWRLQILMMKAVLAYHPGVLLKKTLTMIPCLEHHAKRSRWWMKMLLPMTRSHHGPREPSFPPPKRPRR